MLKGQGLDGFQKTLHPYAFGKSNLSIGRGKWYFYEFMFHTFQLQACQSAQAAPAVAREASVWYQLRGSWIQALCNQAECWSTFLSTGKKRLLCSNSLQTLYYQAECRSTFLSTGKKHLSWSNSLQKNGVVQQSFVLGIVSFDFS